MHSIKFIHQNCLFPNPPMFLITLKQIQNHYLIKIIFVMLII